MKTPNTEGLLVSQTQNILEGMIQPENAAYFSPEIMAPLSGGLTLLENAIAEHTTGKDEVRLNRTLRRAALKTARVFVDDATSVLKPRLGSHPSAEWEKAGMPPGSLAKPKSAADVVLRLTALKAYFTANPTHEVAAVNVTAVRATELGTQLTQAIGALNSALAKTRNGAKVRALAVSNLQHAFRSIIETIATKLAPDSNAWYSLGLPRPVDSRTPVTPAKPGVKQTGPGSVQLTLVKATRATRYRVFVQAPGEEEPKAVATVRDLIAIVEELPAGVPLKFTATAANSTGESQPSEPAEITLA